MPISWAASRLRARISPRRVLFSPPRSGPRASNGCERAAREPRGAHLPPREHFCSPRACASVEPGHAQSRVEFWPP